MVQRCGRAAFRNANALEEGETGDCIFGRQRSCPWIGILLDGRVAAIALRIEACLNATKSTTPSASGTKDALGDRREQIELPLESVAVLGLIDILEMQVTDPPSCSPEERYRIDAGIGGVSVYDAKTDEIFRQVGERGVDLVRELQIAADMGMNRLGESPYSSRAIEASSLSVVMERTPGLAGQARRGLASPGRFRPLSGRFIDEDIRLASSAERSRQVRWVIVRRLAVRPDHAAIQR